jgi:hypothetical protein
MTWSRDGRASPLDRRCKYFSVITRVARKLAPAIMGKQSLGASPKSKLSVLAKNGNNGKKATLEWRSGLYEYPFVAISAYHSPSQFWTALRNVRSVAP